MNRTNLLAVAFLLAVAVEPSAAQVMGGPPGSVRSIFGGNRPVEPNSASQRLSLDVDVSGGSDRYEPAIAPFQDVAAATGSTGIQYWRGRETRFFLAAAEGSVNYETTTRNDLVRGEVLLQGSTNIGRRVQLSGGGQTAYDPAALTTQFGPGLDEIDGGLGPNHAMPSGVVEQPWLASSGYISAVQNWSVRHSTSAEYRTSRRDRRHIVGLESLTQQANVQHNWNFRPGGSASVSYEFGHNRQQTAAVTAPPLRTSSVLAGLSLQRNFTPIRTIGLAVTAGAARAERTGLDDAPGRIDVLPVASVSLSFGLSDVWSLSIDGSHQLSALEGVTPEAFATTSGNVQLRAAIWERFSVSVSGIYSRGAVLSTRTGEFETSQASAQVQYGFGRCCGLFGSYGLYNHRLNGLELVPASFAERYTRQIGRVGLTFWLPLYGAF